MRRLFIFGYKCTLLLTLAYLWADSVQFFLFFKCLLILGMMKGAVFSSSLVYHACVRSRRPVAVAVDESELYH